MAWHHSRRPCGVVPFRGFLLFGSSLAALAVCLTATARAEDPATTITVTDSKDDAPSGKAEEGYRESKADLGPLGSRNLSDTPYTVLSASSDLIANEDVKTFSELTKYLSSLQQQGHPALEFGPPVIRGMQADDSSSNTRIDGMNVRGDTALPIELYDRIDVLTGPSGAFYGFSYPGGTINGILKRPTEKPFEAFSTDYTSYGGYALRGDISGHVDEAHRLGYRLNVLKGDGEPAISHANFKRDLVGLAVDFKPLDGTLVQGAASHYYFEQNGYPAAIAYSGLAKLPSAPDPSKLGMGQSWAGVAAETDLYELKVKQDLGDNWHAEGGILRQNAIRYFNDRLTYTLSAKNDGSYTASYSASSNKNDVTSYTASLRGTLETGPVSHELAFGFNGFTLDSYSSWNSYSGTLSSGVLDDPTLFAEPLRRVRGPWYLSSETRERTLVQSDTITLDSQWSVLGAVSESWLHSESYAKTTGVVTSSATANAEPGWTAAVLYKPVDKVTTYVSYSSSIQPGDTVSTTSGYANAGQVLDPYRSEQYEVGTKATVGKVDLTAAIFLINRPFAAPDTASNSYIEMGTQRDIGVELTAKGKVTDALTVFGGVTWLHNRMVDLDGTPYAGNDGNEVVGVPSWRANLLVEYALPWVEGLTTVADVQYTGRRAANAENTSWASAYATLDLGARYKLDVHGTPVTFKASVDNVFDQRYWMSINGNMNGTNGATNTAYLGSPRTFKLSAAVKF